MSALVSLDADHVDGIPGAPVQESILRAFTCAEFAANAEEWVNFNPAEGRMVLVGNPHHAFFYGAVVYACRGPRTASAGVIDDSYQGRFPLSFVIPFNGAPVF